MTPWFKNLLIYRLNRDIDLSIERLDSDLSAMQFKACGSQDKTSIGWAPPLGNQANNLTHCANNQILLCARKEEKILPTSIIKQKLHAKIDELEKTQHRKLKKTEKDTLKDNVMQELLPRAFSRFSQTWLWLDPTKQLLIVDAASSKRAEEILALLRKSLGSLPVVPLTVKDPISLSLTRWVRSGDLPTSLILGDEAELKGISEQDGIIRCKQQDLSSDEITAHIATGKQVTQLSLIWQQRLQFILCEDGGIKRLKFDETLQEQNADIDKADFAQRFDADFVLMSGELSQLVQQLIDLLGGEVAR